MKTSFTDKKIQIDQILGHQLLLLFCFLLYFFVVIEVINEAIFYREPKKILAYAYLIIFHHFHSHLYEQIGWSVLAPKEASLKFIIESYVTACVKKCMSIAQIIYEWWVFHFFKNSMFYKIQTPLSNVLILNITKIWKERSIDFKKYWIITSKLMIFLLYFLVDINVINIDMLS